MSDDLYRLLTMRECSELVGMSTFALRGRIRRGQGPPAVRLGHSLLVRKKDLLKWLDSLRQDERTTS